MDLSNVPTKPGVYYHKSRDNRIIYVGKAINLRRRLASYFRKNKTKMDTKTRELVKQIASFDYQTTNNEIEALFLEQEMIKRYQPKFNLRDRTQNNLIYIRIDKSRPNPNLRLVRTLSKDNATYYGPYLQSSLIRQALKLLRPIFPFSDHLRIPKRTCLRVDLKLCPGPETDQFNYQLAKRNLDQLELFIQAKPVKLIKSIESEMRHLSDQQKYEEANVCKQQLKLLTNLRQTNLDSVNQNLVNDSSIVELKQVLQLKTTPRRIECYDISHQSGKLNVASMVVFVNGLPSKKDYRHFNLRSNRNDDYYHIRQTLKRRLGNDWPLPDLIVIDGGRGQLTSGLSVLEENGLKIPIIGLAKKREQIICHRKAGVEPQLSPDQGQLITTKNYHVVELSQNRPGILLLRHLRDESHRFGVSYHRLLKTKQQVASPLLAIDQLGPVSYRKLINYFGSAKKVGEASLEDLKRVVNQRLANNIYQHFQTNR